MIVVPAFSKEWIIPSEYGFEKVAMKEISSVLEQNDPTNNRHEDILTAVAEACLNAMEHGNRLNRKLPVRVRMTMYATRYMFRVYDEGSGFLQFPKEQTLKKKWEAVTARGWGLFIIRSVADRLGYGKSEGKFYIQFEFER